MLTFSDGKMMAVDMCLVLALDRGRLPLKSKMSNPFVKRPGVGAGRGRRWRSRRESCSLQFFAPTKNRFKATNSLPRFYGMGAQSRPSRRFCEWHADMTVQSEDDPTFSLADRVQSFRFACDHGEDWRAIRDTRDRTVLEGWLDQCVKNRPSAWRRFAVVWLRNRLMAIASIPLAIVMVFGPLALIAPVIRPLTYVGGIGQLITVVIGVALMYFATWLIMTHPALDDFEKHLRAAEDECRDLYDLLVASEEMIRFRITMLEKAQ